MSQVGGARSASGRSFRETRLDSHPITVPESAHKPRQGKRPTGQSVRYAHLPRVAILALITIALVAAMVAGLTWAYFSDTATTTATFSSGTVDLLICLNGSCNEAVDLSDLPELSNIHPGWSYTTSGLQLYNAGSLTMTVSITTTAGNQSGLAEVIGVQIYRAPSVDGTRIFTGTFQTLETTGPIAYGPLAAEAYDHITFLFDWPETSEDQTELAGDSLSEKITFYGTTEGVEQP